MLPKILVIGCGKKQVKSLKEKFIAIDISEEALEESRRLNPNNEYMKADVMKLPFDKGYFDKIIFTEVLQYVSNLKKAIYETRRVLKNDGVLILSVPIGRTSDFLGKKFPIYEKDVIRGHHKYLFTRELLEELLKGFKDVNIREKDKFSTAYWYIWSMINRKFFKDLKINEEGSVLSERHPKLIRVVNKLVFFFGMIGRIFVGKTYYKTYYVKAIK